RTAAVQAPVLERTRPGIARPPFGARRYYIYMRVYAKPWAIATARHADNRSDELPPCRLLAGIPGRAAHCIQVVLDQLGGEAERACVLDHQLDCRPLATGHTRAAD